MAWLGTWFGTSNTCGVWLNGVGKNRETNQKHNEDCLKEGFRLPRKNFDRDDKGGRETLAMGYCSSNTWNGIEIKLA